MEKELTEQQGQALHRLWCIQRTVHKAYEYDPEIGKEVEALYNLEEYIRQSDSDTIGDDVEALLEHLHLIRVMYPIKTQG